MGLHSLTEKLPSLAALPQINLQMSMWGAHSSAWPSEIRDSISLVWAFWQAPTEVNDYTKVSYSSVKINSFFKKGINKANFP